MSADTKYDAMTGEQLSRLPARGSVHRAAFGTHGNRTGAQQANWDRLVTFNRSQDVPGVGKNWNS